MYSKIKVAGHPVHPMLVGFPVAFYTAALVCYIVYSNNGDPFWFKVALLANVAGVVMAAVAALPGLIDWLNIPSNVKAKKVGRSHMICNVLALISFGAAAFFECGKWNDAAPTLGPAIPLSVVGFVLTLVAGFLGWTMVQKHHVGVDVRADVNS